jgi:ABC-type branched-subunit amino acid transport system ATPase component/predicted MFS family arabinose efflux permease
VTAPERAPGILNLRHRFSALLGAAGTTGLMPIGVLIGMATVTGFDSTAFGVLAPDIRSTFHISTGTTDAIASLTGAVPIMLSVYIGVLGDRMNRINLSAIAGIIWGITAIFTGYAPVLLVLILARLVGGVGLLTGETIYLSLLADFYPPEGLGVIFGSYRFWGQGLGIAAGPLAGVLAAVFGWRSAFVVLALPTFVFVFMLRWLKEPERGVSMGLMPQAPKKLGVIEGYRRVRSIRTVRRTWIAAFLFGGGTLPFATLLSTFFKDVYHYGDTARGSIVLLYGLGGLVGVALGGAITQRLLNRLNFAGMAVANSLFILEFAVGILIMVSVHSSIVAIFGATLLSVGAIGFLPIYTTLISIISPPTLRTQTYGWTLLFYGLGAILIQVVVIGPVVNADGQRPAMFVLAALVAAGGLFGLSSVRFVNGDLAEARKQESASQSTALLSCSGVDVGYGGVQVLFGVDFEIQKGEMVALLGTNGAGKSTFLKAVSGLLDPSGGVMYFNGQDITHTDPMGTARLGIMQVPGGRGVFPTLTVADNLKVAAWMFRKDRRYVAEQTEKVIGYFPILAERSSALAGDLSGGEQQMLSLAQAFIAQPELLLIDELSLGLAPAVVGRLLDIVRDIHASGTTVILVEQSVNTALELAQRAIFMEKGEVRFSGPTAELLERPDILRAVYLQGAAVGQELAGVGDGKDAKSAKGADSPRAAAARLRAREKERAELLAAPVVLQTRGLVKRYGGVTAVSEVDLELHQGQILGLIGPNGAGKTTLFDLISGFAPLNAGRVILHGQDVTALSAFRRAGLGMGRSFQDARLWPSLTVAESIAVALHQDAEIQAAIPAVFGLPQVAESEDALAVKVEDLIELMGLGAFRSKFIAELSTGSRRIVELAAMLAHRPSILLLDEPSSGIAQRETEALGPLIRRIRDQLSCSVLIIEHDIPLINDLADHMVALDLGTVVTVGTPHDVLNDPYVVESYLGTAAGNLHIGEAPDPLESSNGASNGPKAKAGTKS